jgi:hypothetical protein
MKYLSTLCAVTFAIGTSATHAAFTINSSTGLFTPSFRGNPNTSYFGWLGGSGNPGFDSNLTDDITVAGEVINNPTPNLGTAPSIWGLVQQEQADVLTSTNNIYNLTVAPVHFDLTTSSTGGPGGFTTIIIQGRTAFGPFPSNSAISFGTVEGINPSFAIGNNAAGGAQFWAKYEIPGYSSSYTIPFELTQTSVSITQMTVDTQWSASEYAPDTAVVPEPVSLGTLLASTALVLRRRRI